jgi:hypothetical protein
MMRSFGTFVIAAAGLLAMAAMAQEPAPNAPGYRFVGTMSQLMIDIIYPTSDAIFYVDRDPPKNQKQWNDLRSQALMLAEAGNLLLMEGRARDQKNWALDSKMMIDLGAKAYTAAQNKDLDGLRALNDPLNAACVTCHQQYRPGYHRRPPAVETK